MTRLFLTLGVLISLAGPTPVASQFDDTIRVQLRLEPGRLHVETQFPPTNIVFPSFALWPWAGADFTTDVEDLEAFDADGLPALVQAGDDYDWRVSVGGGSFTLRYTVQAWKFTFSGESLSDVHRPTLIDDLAVVGGRAWFLQPLDAELALAPVRVTVEGSYPDISILGGANGTFADSRFVAGSVVLAGELRRRTEATQSEPIHFYLEGDDWRFSDDDLVEAVHDIVEDQAQVMGFVPGGSLDLILVEGADAYAGGMADGSIITLYPDPRLRLNDRDPQTLRLVAHEHFHRWLGEYAVSDPQRGEGRFKWFQEGITEYMAYRTLIRTGHIEVSDFPFKINQYIARYLEHPAAFTATAEELERDYWDDPDLQALPYDKGFLIGLAIDAILRRDSFNRAGIEDFVRAVIGPEGPAEYGDDDLLGALETLSESSWGDFYDRYMLGADPLPMDEICRAAGFDCRRDRGGPMQIHPTNRTRGSLERLIRKP